MRPEISAGPVLLENGILATHSNYSKVKTPTTITISEAFPVCPIIPLLAEFVSKGAAFKELLHHTPVITVTLANN